MGITYNHYIIPRDQSVRPEPDQIATLIKAWIENSYIVQSKSLPAGTGVRFMTSPPFGDALKRAQSSIPSSVGLWARLLGKAKRIPPPDLWIPFSVPPTGDSLTALKQPSAVIQWDGSPSACYPMQMPTQPMIEGDERWCPKLIIELSDDFINPHTDPIGGDARQVTPACGCGCNLEYEDILGWLATERIRRVCPECDTVFRPQDHFAETVNGMTGARSIQMGGLCNRFGIIIAFGKEWPGYARDMEDMHLMEPKVTSKFLNVCSTALGVELNEFSYYG